MMLSLMRDLMNQAQLANNTFTMVNSHFNCVTLIKRCMVTLATQAKHRDVKLVGPVMEMPFDRYFFKQLYSDEQRIA